MLKTIVSTYPEPQRSEALSIIAGDAKALFGDNSKRAAIKYRSLQRAFIGLPSGNEVIKLLDALYASAFTKNSSSSSTDRAPNELDTGKDTYFIGKENLILTGDVYKVFHIGHVSRKNLLLVVRRDTSPNVFEKNLKAIHARTRNPQLYPVLVEAFSLPQKDGVHAAAVMQMSDISFSETSSFFSIAQLIEGFGAECADPKDIAWIWRRLVAILAETQDSGAVIDSPMFAIDTENHNVFSVAFGGSDFNGGIIVDLAKAMLLLGAAELPDKMRRHFRSITPPSNPGEVLVNFDAVIDGLWGKREFHTFSYPRGW